MRIIIMGCGRVGARLALLMESDGHDVTIIDRSPSAFDRLPETFTGQTVLGTGIDVDVLKSAGIETADAFAAVTNFDNTNIMACEVAKEIFGVKKVLARIYDPGRESFYHELGLETVCPTTLVATASRDIMSAQPASDLARDVVHDLHADLTSDGTENGSSRPSTQAPTTAQATASAATPAANGATSGRTPESAVPAPSQGQDSEPATNGNGREGRNLRGFFKHQ